MPPLRPDALGAVARPKPRLGSLAVRPEARPAPDRLATGAVPLRSIGGIRPPFAERVGAELARDPGPADFARVPVVGLVPSTPPVRVPVTRLDPGEAPNSFATCGLL